MATNAIIPNINTTHQNSDTTTAHLLLLKIIKTMKSTCKADKYVRFITNILKLIRTATIQTKTKYSKVYKQLLILRQVFRWQGIYEAIISISQNGVKFFQLKNLPNLSFIFFQIFGDTLDRIMFYIQIIGIDKYQNTYSKVQQLQSDCYFITCFIWLQYHLRTSVKVWKQGNYQQKRNKILKIIKYTLDSLTSYCKFSQRTWELQHRYAAILGITSSLIGLYELLQ